jgi:DNA/RNA endonuclease G (NUC1)
MKRSSSKPADGSAALADVFISYARSNETVARQVADTLRAEGFEVWWDTSIYAGARWRSLLLRTLAAAKAVVVLWSKESVERPWVLREAKIAMDSRKLVPVRIDDCRLPAGFRAVQTAMMPGWTGSGHHPELERLLTGIARHAPPSRIDNVRPGFDTGFLGQEVELPAVTGVADEFRYLHFSVVMNPGRRLAWYVAYNVKPREDVQRGDRWMPDPMLSVSFQPHNDHFRGSGLDRGHIVSPGSISWGTPRQAQLANHQAFFWTNTAPQHPLMNRHWWLALEDWERKNAQAHGRASGFSGPVLADDDPIHRDIEQPVGRLRVRQNFRLPRKFWKIALVESGGELRSAAFLVDGEALLKNGASHAAKPGDFRCTVADIEALTRLDFGAAVRAAPPIG